MSTELETRKEQLKSFLLPAQKQITSLLQDKTKAQKFMAAALVVASNPSLKNCSPDSIVQALVGVAMSDLNIDSNLSQCYLVPYKGHAQLQIGYKGFIQLLFRAGWMVKCFPVYQCDEFSMSFDGWDNNVEFKPNIDERDEGDRDWVFNNLRGIYVVSRHTDTKDEYSTFVAKPLIEKLRLSSPNQRIGNYTKPADKERLKNGLPIGIWGDWYIEMAQAKAIKKLAKILPIGDNREAMSIAMDDKQEAGKPVNYKESIEQGVIIEMDVSDEDKSSLDALLTSIHESTNIEGLSSLTTEAEKFSGADLKTIRTIWSEKLKEFKQEKGPVNNKELIKACKNADELSNLLKDISEVDQLELSDAIDDRFDDFR